MRNGTVLFVILVLSLANAIGGCQMTKEDEETVTLEWCGVSKDELVLIGKSYENINSRDDCNVALREIKDKYWWRLLRTSTVIEEDLLESDDIQFDANLESIAAQIRLMYPGDAEVVEALPPGAECDQYGCTLKRSLPSDKKDDCDFDEECD